MELLGESFVAPQGHLTTVVGVELGRPASWKFLPNFCQPKILGFSSSAPTTKQGGCVPGYAVVWLQPAHYESKQLYARANYLRARLHSLSVTSFSIPSISKCRVFVPSFSGPGSHLPLITPA